MKSKKNITLSISIGKKIKEVREFVFPGRGSQKKLAAELNISQPQLADYESGKRQPSERRLEEIARALHTTVSILRGEGEFDRKIGLAIASDPHYARELLAAKAEELIPGTDTLAMDAQDIYFALVRNGHADALRDLFPDYESPEVKRYVAFMFKFMGIHSSLIVESNLRKWCAVRHPSLSVSEDHPLACCYSEFRDQFGSALSKRFPFSAIVRIANWEKIPLNEMLDIALRVDEAAILHRALQVYREEDFLDTPSQNYRERVKKFFRQKVMDWETLDFLFTQKRELYRYVLLGSSYGVSTPEEEISHLIADKRSELKYVKELTETEIKRLEALRKKLPPLPPAAPPAEVSAPAPSPRDAE